MEEGREQLGKGPLYLAFYFDALDPACAPAAGTAEIGGLTVQQGLEITRGYCGLDLVGAGDMSEVAPAYYSSDNSSLTTDNLLFEMLCVLPAVAYHSENFKVKNQY